MQLSLLCKELKALLLMLKPSAKGFSFILVIGKLHQGKSALLRQCGLTPYASSESSVSLFYHDTGIVLELCESWLSQSKHLLEHTLKQFNQLHPLVKITGLVLCVDVQVFLHTEPLVCEKAYQEHAQWLKRFTQALGYPVDIAVFLTKCDALAGFIPFFQSEHPSEWLKPLGFALESQLPITQALKHYRSQYDRLIEYLGQRVLPKLHAVRSGVMRTVIREFPLQLASLRAPLQGFIAGLLQEGHRLQGLYWMSAEPKAEQVDRLHHKIANAYGLVAQDNHTGFRQSHAYFVHGACHVFQAQTQKTSRVWPRHFKWIAAAGMTIFLALLITLAYDDWRTVELLDETSQELLAYDVLMSSQRKQTAATYHLSQALQSLHHIPFPMQHLDTVKQLKHIIGRQAEQTLHVSFLPQLLQILEQEMSAPNATPSQRYDALKTYLQFEKSHFSSESIRSWFLTYWETHLSTGQEKGLKLLNEVLSQPLKDVVLNQQLIRDTRNYLNALPLSYLYYALAKPYLSQQKVTVDVPGFTLSQHEVARYYTQTGFKETLEQLPALATKLMAENWVLARQDLDQVLTVVQQAYCFEYVTFWQQFMQYSKPQTMSSFHEGQILADRLYQSKSFAKLIQLVQDNTSPIQGSAAQLFNERVASQFTSLHFLSHKALEDLNQAVHELVNFLATLSIVQDTGQTAFSFTKARFEGDTFSDSLSALYQRAHALPKPISLWVKQLADEVWSLLIQQSRAYLNQRWQSEVYTLYESSLAHRFPFDAAESEEVKLSDFEQFFAPQGRLATFTHENIKPFLDTRQAQWKAKSRNGFVMPISDDMMNELIRANVISNMFFEPNSQRAHIVFGLEKMTLDPVVSRFSLTIGQTKLEDNQSTHSQVEFQWPAQDASLQLESIEGGHYALEEQGVWAFFKMLQKVNVLVDTEDAGTLQILFEVNGNSGRYVLRTENQINPFSPGILDGFMLKKTLV